MNWDLRAKTAFAQAARHSAYNSDQMILDSPCMTLTELLRAACCLMALGVQGLPWLLKCGDVPKPTALQQVPQKMTLVILITSHRVLPSPDDDAAAAASTSTP